MTKTEEALLPCPFCGAEAEMIGPLEEHENEGGYAVCCKCCQASSSVVFPDKVNPEDVLFPKWNTRTPEGQEMPEVCTCDPHWLASGAMVHMSTCPKHVIVTKKED